MTPEERRRAQYGPDEFQAWMRAEPCAVRGCRDRRIQLSHSAKSRAAGGRWWHQIPLCIEHHAMEHALGIITFAERCLGLERDRARDVIAEMALSYARRWSRLSGHDLFGEMSRAA